MIIAHVVQKLLGVSQTLADTLYSGLWWPPSWIFIFLLVRCCFIVEIVLKTEFYHNRPKNKKVGRHLGFFFIFIITLLFYFRNSTQNRVSSKSGKIKKVGRHLWFFIFLTLRCYFLVKIVLRTEFHWNRPTNKKVGRHLWFFIFLTLRCSVF